MMEVTIQGMRALRQLRLELQEDAGLKYPGEVITQLLMLHDVCKYLELNIFQTRYVLGEVGWLGVNEYIERPACISVNEQAVQCVDGEFTVVE